MSILVADAGARGSRATVGSAPALRLVAFGLIASVILLGPAVEHVFGWRTQALRSWIMFSRVGLGVIDARFTIADADGAQRPLDRFAMLGASPTGRIKRIDNVEELDRVIGRLCKAAPAGSDIRVHARRATRHGWRLERTGTRNACADG